MNNYFRIITFAKPVTQFVILYFLFVVIASVFKPVSFAFLSPVLDLLFQKVSVQDVVEKPPSFSFSIDYFKNLFEYYFQEIINTKGRYHALLFTCAIVAFSVFISNLFSYLSRVTADYFRARAIKRLRTKLYEKLISLPVGYLNQVKKGDLMAKLSTDIAEIEVALLNVFTTFGKNPILLIVYATGLIYISYKITLFALILIPVSGFIISFIAKRLKKDALGLQSTLSYLLSAIDETLWGSKIIKSFGVESYFIQKFDTASREYARHFRAQSRKRESASPISEVLGVIVVVGILLYGGKMILDDTSDLSGGDFIAYIAIFSQILTPAKAINSGITQIQRGIIASNRVFELLDQKIKIKETPSHISISSFQKELSFNNVSFAYEEGKEVLKDLSFTIPKGNVFALVGPSGAGKSTISDLIPRFYDVTKGEITIDEINIKKLSLHELRGLTGIVTQEPILFHDTIFNNIAFATESVSKEKVIEAAKVANAHEFIMDTENRYNTIIGDRGVKLSGGQRQRISIARAVYKNPDILILDEATSSLDTESEKLVQDALGKLMQGKTALVIAHRLSTIQNADQILVLDQGKIIEQGTHDELMGKNGLYKRLQSMQA